VLDWPELDAPTRARIVSLPIWDIAVQTEGKARLRMAAYAGTLPDPDMRAALALNAWEEQRHKEVLSRMVAAYGIALAPEPVPLAPLDPERACLVTGYSECVDSFFAFGLLAQIPLVREPGERRAQADRVRTRLVAQFAPRLV
jgi:hypothetical protein